MASYTNRSENTASYTKRTVAASQGWFKICQWFVDPWFCGSEGSTYTKRSQTTASYTNRS